jgi:hypothetical protein
MFVIVELLYGNQRGGNGKENDRDTLQYYICVILNTAYILKAVE